MMTQPCNVFRDLFCIKYIYLYKIYDLSYKIFTFKVSADRLYIENVCYNPHKQEAAREDAAPSPEPHLPVLHSPVLEEHHANQTAHHRAREVRHVAGAARAGVDEAGDDVHTEEPHHHQQSGQPHHLAEHGGAGLVVSQPLPQDERVLPPVEQQRSHVGASKGVHPA